MKCKWVLLLLLLSEGVSSFAQQPVIGTVDSNLVKTLFFSGLRNKLNENYTEANASFNKIIAIDPKNAAVHYEIAMMAFRQNKLTEAEAALKKAIALDKNNVWYWKLMAELYKRKDDMVSLTGVFNQLIRLSPNDDSYYFDRSNAWLLAGNTENALKGFDELEQKFGPSVALTEARQRINLEKNDGLTKQEMSRMLSEDGKDVRSLLYTAGILIQKEQNEAALALLKKASLMDAGNFETDLLLANVYKALKNEPEANAALKRAFNNSEMPADRKVKVFMILFADAKDRQSIDNVSEMARIMINLYPDDPKILAMYGDVLYRQGDLNGALSQFKSALKVTDQIYAVWERVLDIQTSLGLYKEAIKTGDEALSVYPNQAILYYYMAFALLSNVQYDEALINIKMALQLDEGNTLYTECYGDVLFLKGDKAAALIQWKKARDAGNDSEKLNKKINESKYFK